jgi:hypothetical protein
MIKQRFNWALYSKAPDLVETLVARGEYPINALEPQYYSARIKASDNFVVIPIPAHINFSFVTIKATYSENDPAVISPVNQTGGVKKGDPAPLICRFNGVIHDFYFPLGFMSSTMDLNDLQIATPYDTNKIFVEIHLG